MPKGTKVSRCVDKVKKSKDEGAAIAICQDSTKQGYATGRKLKESIAKRAKKIGDSSDDKWEKEEKKKGYKTPSADDSTGYDSSTDDNASDDFSDGAWNKEDAPKKFKKKLKESLLSLVEKQAAKRVNPGEGDKAGSSDSDEYVSGGRTGKTTIQGRLTGIRTKKASPSAGVRVKNYTAGPKGRLPDWTFYKQIGSVLAEKLGFSQTQMDAQKNALKPLNPKPKRAKTPSLTAGGNTTTGANAAGDEGVPVGNDANKKAQELKQQNIKTRSMYEKDNETMDKQWNKERIDEVLPAIAAGLARAGAMVGRGVAKAGAAVTKTAGKAAGKAAGQAGKYLTKKAGEHAKGMVKTGVKRTLATAKEKLSSKDETMEDSTQYKNNYVRKLMEMDGPTETNEGRSSRRLRQTATQSQGLKRRKDTSVGGPQGKEVAAEFVKKALAGHTKPAIGGDPRKPKASEMNSHTEYHRIGKLFAEAHQSHIDPESKKELARGDADAGFAGPTARRIGRGQKGTSDIKDQGVKKVAKAAGERVKAKVPGAKPEKIATKHLVGAAMIRTRRESRQRLKAGKGREGDSIPAETPDVAKADAAHSRKKVQDAGER